MKAIIFNYRGVSTATIESDKIALVSAPNGGGKSSCCQAVGAALTGEPMPIDDENGNSLAKAKAGCLVRSGTVAGGVKLESSTGSTEVSWPNAKTKTIGQAPAASTFAAGLDSIVTMEAKKRIPFLIDYLKAQPIKEDLAKAIGNIVPAGTIDKLWELIETQGWDATYAQVKEKGAKYKGQWEDVTNANYGAKIAESWLPTGYEPNLEGSSEDTLRAVVTDARDSLEASIAASAVDDSKRQDLEAVAGLLSERQAALDNAKKPLPEDAALKTAGLNVESEKTILLGLENVEADLRTKAPRADTPPTKFTCPCCSSDLMMKQWGGALEKYSVSGPTQADIDAHAVKLSAAVKNVSDKEKEIATIQSGYDLWAKDRQAAVDGWNQGIADASRLVRESTTAQTELDGMAAPIAAQVGASVEQCRNDLAAHELRLQAFMAKFKADFLHGAIIMNQALLKRVAPTGVRADVLASALTGLNETLAGLSATAAWPGTQITPEFGFTFSGTPYFLLSSAEQFRVRAIVQVAMAAREKAAMIIVDGADILDKGGRNGLFRLLKSTGIPALVGMTINVETEVPNLAKAGYGRSYWISDAIAKAI